MELARNYITWGVLKDSGDKLEIAEEYHYILEWMLVEFIEICESSKRTYRL
jgi:hypothetical protein